MRFFFERITHQRLLLGGSLALPSIGDADLESL